MVRNFFLIFLLFISGLLNPTGAPAQNWPQWRGPEFNGSSSATGLPTIWSTTENVKWKTPMPGASGATPAIWEDRVFVTSLDNRTKDLLGMCIDKGTGEVLWRKKLGIGFSDQGRGKNMASPSPVTDGKTVFFMFGTTDLSALDFEGNILWQKNLEREYGKLIMNFGHHSSPMLYEGKLYLEALHRSHPDNDDITPEGVADSYLLILDPANGEEIARHVRNNKAKDESQEAYSTPIPMEWQGRKEILMVGGDVITGHNPETGEEYWRWGQWNPKKINHWRMVPSPVFHEGVIFVCAPKQDPVYAIKAGLNGTVEDEAVVWVSEEATSDVCVPLVYKDRLYVLNGDNQKELSCLDPKTGKLFWKGEVGGRAVFRASPTGADDKIYCINEDGYCVVVGTGDQFEILHTVEMEEGLSRSTIVPSDGHLFIRTAENLYCIGE
jgi:outer membrane protein assembly factor BamB